MTQFDPALTARALTARVPRYTSYPPATQFDGSVGPDVAGRWLGAVPAGAAISLYAHIPFCRRLCWFCACRTQGTRTDAPLAPYVDDLLREAETVAAALPAGVGLSHLHLGGGTPTLLPAPLLLRLFAGLRDLFPLRPGAEVSVEVDPTELGEARLDALAEAGVTRASLGVQDFAPQVQDAIGRHQNFAQTKAAIDGLRARGITGINLDLLYGLPHQTEATLRDTLDLAETLDPDRIALFGYAHVPWASKRQVMIKADALPDGGGRLAMFDLARARLVQAGFERIGIDHFARPDDPLATAARDGRLRRNFQGYTTDDAGYLVGLGASAISMLPHGFAQNAARTADWKARVQAGRLSVVRGHTLTSDDRVRGAAIERLLCDFALDADDSSDPAMIRQLIDRAMAAWPGAMVRRGNRVAILPEAEHLARMIAAEFDGYVTQAGRHSVAV